MGSEMCIRDRINSDPAGFATHFSTEHGPCASAMAWRVADAQLAFKHAVANGAEPFVDEGVGKTVDWPAIKGIGGSLIYFTDQYFDTSPYLSLTHLRAHETPEHLVCRLLLETPREQSIVQELVPNTASLLLPIKILP